MANIAADRAALAAYAASGQFHANKPIEQYSAAYTHRAVSEIARHGELTRGHTNTPEHGRVSAPVAVAGREVYTTNSSQQADKIINAAAAAGQRVSVTVTDSKGVTATTWTNTGKGHAPGGISARYVRDDMRGKKQGARRYLEGTKFTRRTKRGGYTRAYKPKGIVSMQITVY